MTKGSQQKFTPEGKYDFKPDRAHQQLQIDIMYLCINHRWHFFVDILDVYSRYIVNWDLLETASAADIWEEYPILTNKIGLKI